MTSPTDSLRIRAAIADDAPRIAALLEQLGYPTTSDEAAARLAKLANSPNDHVLVAEREDSGVTGVLALHRMSALHQSGDVAKIMALVVDENRRGEKVGERLVQGASALARERGCTTLMVTTHVRRDGAHRFYERLGFAFTGRRYVLPLG